VSPAEQHLPISSSSSGGLRALPGCRIAEHWIRSLFNPAPRSAIALEALWVGCWLASLAAVLVRWASIKPYWLDEVLATWIASRDSYHGIMRALLAGINIDPPLFHVLVHHLFRLFGQSELVARLPGIAGFLTLCTALYVYVRRRAGPIYGCAALLLPVPTLYWFYATDARPYGLLGGLAALATLFWARSSEGPHRKRWAAAFALTLGAALSCHFFAVFLLVPFGLSLATRILRRQPGTLLQTVALAVGVLPLIAWAPIAINARQFSTHYFSPPSLGILTFGIALSLADVFKAAPFFLVGLVALGFVPSVRSAFWQHPNIRLFDEFILITGYLLTPALALAAGILTLSVFHPRYVLFFLIGTFLAVPLVVHRAFPLNRLVAILLLLCVAFVPVQYLDRMSTRPVRTEDTQLAFLLAHLPEPDSSVLVPDSNSYFVLFHYAKPTVRGRLAYVYSPTLALQMKKVGYDTTERVYAALGSQCNCHIFELESYLRRHRRFYLLDTDASLTKEWISVWLRGMQLRQHTVARSGSTALIEVEQLSDSEPR